MRLLFLLAMLGWPAMIYADSGEPSLEMLLFLADFVDEQGNWDGPDMEEPAFEQDNIKGDGHE